ncbi:hypothetical protein [Streptomyces sp. NPDC001635]
MPTSHVPGRDPLPTERLEAIRAQLDTAPRDVVDLLGEVDRHRETFDALAVINEQLIDAVGRTQNVVFHPIIGALCRVCHADLEGKPDGCDRHSPVLVLRRIVRSWEDLNARYADREAQAEPGAERGGVQASRGLEAYELFSVLVELMRPLLAEYEDQPTVKPEDTPGGLIREALRRASKRRWRTLSVRRLTRLAAGDAKALPPAPPAPPVAASH